MQSLEVTVHMMWLGVNDPYLSSIDPTCVMIC
jgi:hypothetical protein